MAHMTVKNQGELLQFLSAGDANISSCKVYFSPKQSGEGTPSPENVRPIEGWSGVEVTHCGKNLLPDNGWNNGYYLNAKGVMKENDLLKISPYLSLLPDIYHFSGTNGSKEIITTSFHAYDENKQWLRRFAYVTANPSETYDFTFTIPNDAKYIAISTVNELINGQLEIGEITTNFEPYQSRAEKELPSEYQRVEWIGCNGFQYIATDYTPTITEDMKIEIDYMFTHKQRGDSFLFGSKLDNNSDTVTIQCENYNNSRWYCSSGIWQFRNILYECGNNFNTRYSLVMDGNVITVDNSAYTTSETRRNSNAAPIYIFAGNWLGKMQFINLGARIYSLTFTADGVKEAEFVPCYRKSDSKPGMYDTVSQTFYTNQGTGEFIAGPAVNRYEIDWSEDLGTIYGGYVDLVSGELVEEFAKVTLDGSFSPGIFPWQSEVVEDDTGETLVNALYLKRNTAQSWKNRNIYLTAVCDKLPCMSNYNIKQRSCSFYDGDSYSICLALPKSLVGTTATELNQYLSENPITTSFRLNAPITHQLSPAILTTLTGSNTFWSNADYIEIEYDLIETQEIMDVRKRIIGSFPHLETAGGQFSTDIAAPLKSCRISFSPIQEGEGDPSPSNVRPIKGWDGITVTRCGKNLLQDNSFWEQGQILTGGNRVNNNCRIRTKGKMRVKPNTTYTISGSGGIIPAYHQWTNDQKYISDSGWKTQLPYTFTTSSTTEWIDLTCKNNTNNNYGSVISPSELGSKYTLQIELGSTATEYEPYTETSITIPFPQTIYGGYVDLIKGEIVEEQVAITLDGVNVKFNKGSYPSQNLYGAGWVYANPLGLFMKQENKDKFLCDKLPIGSSMSTIPHYDVPRAGNLYYMVRIFEKSDYADELTNKQVQDLSNEWLQDNPLTFVYPLKTANVYSLTPQTIKALKGINNVFSDANGSVELTYWTH